MADDALIYLKPNTDQGTPGLHEEMIYFEKEIRNSYAETDSRTQEDYPIVEEADLVTFGQLVTHGSSEINLEGSAMSEHERKEEDEEGRSDINFEESSIAKTLENFSRFQEVGAMGDRVLILPENGNLQKSKPGHPITFLNISLSTGVILFHNVYDFFA